MELIDFCGLHKIYRKILVLAQMGIVHPQLILNLRFSSF